MTGGNWFTKVVDANSYEGFLVSLFFPAVISVKPSVVLLHRLRHHKYEANKRISARYHDIDCKTSEVP